MRAELIRVACVGAFRHLLRHPRLPEIVCARTFRHRTYAVPPVITVRKAAPGPAHIRRAYPPHLLDEPLTDSIDIGDLRITSHPHSAVDHSSDVFNEMPVQMFADLCARPIRIDLDARVCRRVLR